MISQQNLLSRACLQGSDQPLEARKVVRDSGYAAKEPELKETPNVSFVNAGFFVKKLLGGDTLNK
jgi:hypothetical protein